MRRRRIADWDGGASKSPRRPARSRSTRCPSKTREETGMPTFAIDMKRRRWLALTGLGAALAIAGRFDAHAAEPRVIKIHARKFVFTPNKITLTPHEPVVFELTPQATIMGFSIPQYNI